MDLSLETPNYKKFKLEFRKTAAINRELKRAIQKNISPVKTSKLNKHDTIQEEQDSWDEAMSHRSTLTPKPFNRVRQKSDTACLKAQQLFAFNNFSGPPTSSRTNKSQDPFKTSISKPQTQRQPTTPVPKSPFLIKRSYVDQEAAKFMKRPLAKRKTKPDVPKMSKSRSNQDHPETPPSGQPQTYYQPEPYTHYELLEELNQTNNLNLHKRKLKSSINSDKSLSDNMTKTECTMHQMPRSKEPTYLSLLKKENKLGVRVNSVHGLNLSKNFDEEKYSDLILPKGVSEHHCCDGVGVEIGNYIAESNTIQSGSTFKSGERSDLGVSHPRFDQEGMTELLYKKVVKAPVHDTNQMDSGFVDIILDATEKEMMKHRLTHFNQRAQTLSAEIMVDSSVAWRKRMLTKKRSQPDIMSDHNARSENIDDIRMHHSYYEIENSVINFKKKDNDTNITDDQTPMQFEAQSPARKKIYIPNLLDVVENCVDASNQGMLSTQVMPTFQIPDLIADLITKKVDTPRARGNRRGAIVKPPGGLEFTENSSRGVWEICNQHKKVFKLIAVENLRRKIGSSDSKYRDIYNRRFEASFKRIRSLTPRIHYDNTKEGISSTMEQLKKKIDSAQKSPRSGCSRTHKKRSKTGGRKTGKDKLKKQMIPEFEELAKSTKGMRMHRLKN